MSSHKENKIEAGKTRHFLLLPGLLAPKEILYPLVRYLRRHQSEYGVAAIPLGLSISDFSTLVNGALGHISRQLPQETFPEKIVLFGHSHGGRVAFALAKKLKECHSSTDIAVITAGTPMIKRPSHLAWYTRALFSISNAYRNWPTVPPPDSSVVSKIIGYYSTNDRTVLPEYARADYPGPLTELHGLSHRDLITPEKIGPHLLKVMATE